jgi:hypothetical protein
VPHITNVTELPHGRQQGGAYSMGYQDGMHFGAQCASERYFWIGVVIGCVISTVIVLAILNLTGGTK